MELTYGEIWRIDTSTALLGTEYDTGVNTDGILNYSHDVHRPRNFWVGRGFPSIIDW